MMRSGLVGVLAVFVSACSCSEIPPEGPTAAATCTPACAPNERCEAGLCIPAEEGAPLEVADGALLDAQVGQAYSHAFAATGGNPPYQFALVGGEMAGGLALETGGALQGTPTAPGSVEFSVEVTDASAPPRSARRSFLLRVGPAPLTFGEPLPDAQVAVGYAATIVAAGGTRPHTFALVPGSRLPDGLSLSPEGAITGTPTTVGTAHFQVQVADSSAPPLSLVGTFVLRVRTATGHLPLEFVTETVPQGQTGQPYEAPLEVTGGQPPYAVALAEGSALPPGLQLVDGAIVGVPTAVGDYDFDLEVRDAAPSDQVGLRTFGIRVVPGPLGIGPVALADGMLGVSYSGQLVGIGGVAPYEFTLESGALPPGLTLAADGTLSGMPAAHGSFEIVVRVTDSDAVSATATRAYSLRVAPAPLVLGTALPEGRVGQAYTAPIPVSGGVVPYQFRLLDGTLPPPGLALSANGSLAGTPTAAGTYRMSLEVLDAGLPASRVVQTFDLVVRTENGDLLLEITTTALPDARLGEPYRARIDIAGGRPLYLFSLDSGTVMPDGLQLLLGADGNSGLIEGIPARAGTYELLVQVEDGAAPSQLASRSFLLRVQPASGTELLTFLPTQLEDAWVGQPYSAQLSASGGAAPYRFGLTAESQLPPGLYVDAAGAVRGTPFATGTFAFSAAVWDASDPYQMATRTLTLTVRSDVAGGQLTITSLTLRKLKVGKAYRAQLTATGGSGSYFWRLMFGTLPPGITLDARGLLSGTTEVQGLFPVTIEAWDEFNAGLRTQATLLLRGMATGSAGLRFQMAAYAQGSVGTSYLQAIRMLSAVVPLTYAMEGASPGLAITSDGSATAWLGGTPQVAGRFGVTVRAVEARLNGDEALRHDFMTVLPDPSGLLLSTSMLPQGKVGLDYAVQLTASGGSGSYAFAAVDGTALPANLTLDPNGRVGGVPVAAGVTAVVVEVRDVVTGRAAKTQFLVEIAP